MTPEHGVYGEVHELRARIAELELVVERQRLALLDAAEFRAAAEKPARRTTTPKQET